MLRKVQYLLCLLLLCNISAGVFG
ncbi:RepA leader peptide Tap [Serratia sp. UGAL515B_01]|nr:RepA leader peptide Tap [Serratia sp. UGAL515B_01]